MNNRLAGIISPLGQITTVKPPCPVYCETTINHLKSITGIHISPGLTNQEISAVESSMGCSFPLDLRLILQTGLPVGTNFPNWRTGLTRINLLLLFNLPFLHISKIVTRNGFWIDSWGIRPESDGEALSLVKKLMKIAPVLVPFYGNYYVPSTTPNLAGNPVFQIDGDEFRVLDCDVAGFLQGLNRLGSRQNTKRRRVEFWSDVAERGSKMVVARDPTRKWWSASACEELKTCFDEAFLKLRDGGWTDDEIRDMLLMDGADQGTCTSPECDGNKMDEGDIDTCTEEDHPKRPTLGDLLLFRDH